MAETREIFITVHPFDPRQKKPFETGMKGMKGIRRWTRSLCFPLLLRPLSLYFFILVIGQPQPQKTGSLGGDKSTRMQINTKKMNMLSTDFTDYTERESTLAGDARGARG